MALATQCPHCQTTFRVAQDQLKLRAGLVRCGSCKEIFNGVEHLLPADDSHVAPPHKLDAPIASAVPLSPAAPQPIAQQPHTEMPAVTPVVVPHAQSKTVPTANDLDFAYPEPIPEPESEPIIAAAEIAAKPIDVDFVELPRPIQSTLIDEPQHAHLSHSDVQEPHQESIAPISAIEDHFIADLHDSPIEESTTDQIDRNEPFIKANTPSPAKPPVEQDSGHAKTKRTEPKVDEEEPETNNEDEPSFVKQGRRQQKFGKALRISMGIGAVLLLLTGLGQAAYAFRSQIVARVPETKPVLLAVCTVFRCNIGLPAQIESLSIESNDLETLGPNKSASELSILVRNNSATVESWPHLELTLNDANGNMLSRRVFTPSEYLSSTQELKKGLASNAEQPIKLYLEISNIKPSGYHVDLFYP